MEHTTAIQRHKTAIRRGDFSRPLKCLLRDGLMGRDATFFDYGCGRGEDLELLSSEGFACTGWDPAFRPDAARLEADVVNLGYVINVIEDTQERAATLRGAWELARQVLTVSAQVLMAGRGKDRVEFGDGVLTNRGTFQKFFEQDELKNYLEGQLQTEAIPAGIGTFYLFKNEARRQQFLSNRFRRREILPRRRIAELRLEEAREALEPLMEVIASLGRLPDPSEFDGTPAVIERYGSVKRAFAVIQRITDVESWEAIARRRREDMLVYLPTASYTPASVKFFTELQCRLACDPVAALIMAPGDLDRDASARRWPAADQSGVAANQHRPAGHNVRPAGFSCVCENPSRSRAVRKFASCRAHVLGRSRSALPVCGKRSSGRTSATHSESTVGLFTRRLTAAVGCGLLKGRRPLRRSAATRRCRSGGRSSMFHTSCPHCQTKWSFGEQYAGGIGICPKCGAHVRLSSRDGVEAEVVPDGADGAVKTPKTLVSGNLGCLLAGRILGAGPGNLKWEVTYRTAPVRFERPDRGSVRHVHQCPFCSQELTFTVANIGSVYRWRLYYVVFLIGSIGMTLISGCLLYFAERVQRFPERFEFVVIIAVCASVIALVVTILLAPVMFSPSWSLGLWVSEDGTASGLNPRQEDLAKIYKTAKHKVCKP